MKEKETFFSIQNEEQIDSLKKPRISFYSTRKKIQRLLALPEVKKDLRSYVKDGKRVDVSKKNNDFIGIDFYNKDGSWDNCWTSERRSSHPYTGMGVLQQGLDNIGKTARIIREDIDNEDNFIYRLSGGVTYGLATPFDIKGGMKHFEDNSLSNDDDAGGIAQILYSTFVPAAAAVALISANSHPELNLACYGTAAAAYLATVAATNIGINAGRYFKSLKRRE